MVFIRSELLSDLEMKSKAMINFIMRRADRLIIRLFLAAIFCTIFLGSSSAQLLNPPEQGDTTRSLLTRKNVITAGIVAHTAFTFVLEYKWWWEGNYHPFGFVQEGFLNDVALGVDKFGHFYTHHVYFHALYNILKWGGYDESMVLWASTIVPALYGLSLEIGDGYSSYLFSTEDLVADLLGIGYGLLQVKHPFFNNLKIKWSYFPVVHVNSFDHPFSEDYDGHIYWLSANVHNLLPESAQNYWPRFLNVAVGYGGKNISAGSEGPKLRKLAIALDYNLIVLPLNGETWDPIKNIIDLFHFPAPGVRIIETEPAEIKPVLLH
jgi:hypothetical protein